MLPLPPPWPAAQARILIAGLVASRTGLWLFDLAVTQIVQESVADSEIGKAAGRGEAGVGGCWEGVVSSHVKGGPSHLPP